jgi:hypothetical protein
VGMRVSWPNYTVEQAVGLVPAKKKFKRELH